MSKISFGDFTKSVAKKIYKTMWEDNVFIESNDVIIERNGVSGNSYCFSGNDNKCELLIDLFSIKNPKLFREKFKMACGGSGQEEHKITTLHSSSLCALLFFYNVTKDNPLDIQISDKRYRFTESVFEFKSPVIKNPSNMDVVLVGKELESEQDNGQDTVLFLESKFSEYCKEQKVSAKISNEYRNDEHSKYSKCFYEDDFLKSLELKIGDCRNKKDKEKYFVLESTGKAYYIDGIKQMISHYTGIRNILDNKSYTGWKSESQKRAEEAIDKGNNGKGANIILAEILFDSKIGVLKDKKGQPYLDSYAEAYKKFAEKANDLTKGLGEQFRICEEELCYSLFKDNEHKVEEKILQFYNLR